jgi:hypothetical protein
MRFLSVTDRSIARLLSVIKGRDRSPRRYS